MKKLKLRKAKGSFIGSSRIVWPDSSQRFPKRISIIFEHMQLEVLKSVCPPIKGHLEKVFIQGEDLENDTVFGTIVDS